MNRNKIEESNDYMSPDTVEFKSRTAVTFDFETMPYVHQVIVRTSDNSYSYYVINVDKAYAASIGKPQESIGVYNYSDYKQAITYALDKLGLESPSKNRIDFRFDSFDDNYNELLKLNKLVVLLLANYYNISNRYESHDLLTQEALTMRIQNDRIEAENYNKGLQEPDGEVKNRLELRSKHLPFTDNENKKEWIEFDKWCDRLDKVITADNLNSLVSAINTALIERFKEWSRQKGHTLSNFIVHYENCFFTSRQLENFLALLIDNNLTSITDCKESAKKYKKRYKLEFFSLKDLQVYKVKIVESGAGFFEM